MATYTQKPQMIEAFTFPQTVFVTLDETDGTSVRVSRGDYLLFSNGGLSVVPKKEFQARHTPVSIELTPPPKEKKKRNYTKKGGLGRHPLTNGPDQEQTEADERME